MTEIRRNTLVEVSSILNKQRASKLFINFGDIYDCFDD